MFCAKYFVFEHANNHNAFQICNHPDLLQQPDAFGSYGDIERSGKLKVALEILKLWKAHGDKALVFTQTQIMLDILEFHIQKEGYSYYRMDGCTGIRHREQFIRSFNSDENVFVFLLTTRVGGLGVNLTGANRVLLYDPDWNPSVDVQARERAWRIGQMRDVVIYRLITSGTIEEKIYHRQMFKKLLTNKVLKQGIQKRLFKSDRIRDLFTLQENANRSVTTETEALMNSIQPSEASDSILAKLFQTGTVDGSVNQKEIEEAQGTERRDGVWYQATVVAEEAKKRLEIAGERRARFGVHSLTWTGKNGTAGAPPSFDQASEFGLRNAGPGVCALTAPSSTSLLQSLQKRKEMKEPETTSYKAFEMEASSTPLIAKPLPASRPASLSHAPALKSVKRKNTEPVDTALILTVSEKQKTEWKTLILQFFKQRGRVINADQMNALVSRIEDSKHRSFKSFLETLSKRLQSRERWVLNPDL